MTAEDSKRLLAAYWMEKARAALISARLEYEHHQYDFAVNRAYYAAFYAATAILLLHGRKFSKHSGVRAAVHRDLAKEGLIPPALARWYDTAFDSRQKGDYTELVSVGEQEAEIHIAGAREFISAVTALLDR